MTPNEQGKQIVPNSDNHNLKSSEAFEDAVRRIREYGGVYDPNIKGFDVWNQLLACESVAESTAISENSESKNETNVNASVSGVFNGTRKQHVNFELTSHKLQIISELSVCTYRTPPIKISHLLEKFFEEYSSNEGHWLYIAQNWNPRAINRTLAELVRIQVTGEKSIQNAAAYFTYLVKYRKPRRK